MAYGLKRRALIASILFTSASMVAMQPSIASADELSALKAQLEALQARVDDLSAQPRQPQLPDGVSLLTVNRGSMESDKFDHLTQPGDEIPEGRGFTIAVTPTADLPPAPPAPVHEITIGGYVKGDVIYDFDQPNADFFLFSNLQPAPDDEHIRLHARQSRFNIKSRSETAIGEIRTLIEGDFFGSAPADFRLRHAFGEWDMTPNWTFGAGQTWSNFIQLWDLAQTIDFNGPAAGPFARQAQVRLTYSSGPLLAAVAIEEPSSSFGFGAARPAGFSFRDGSEIPDFTGKLDYTFPGQHRVGVTGIVGENRIESNFGDDDDVFWGVVGAAQVHLMDRVILTSSGGFGDGNGRYITGTDVNNTVTFDAVGAPRLNSREFWHVQGHVNVTLTETLSGNGAVGYIDFDSGDTLRGQTDDIVTIHGNILWQPVRQLRMGIEGMWAERDIEGRGDVSAARAQFGAWFFF